MARQSSDFLSKSTSIGIITTPFKVDLHYPLDCNHTVYIINQHPVLFRTGTFIGS